VSLRAQVEPLMRQYDVISEVLLYMEELGWKPYQARNPVFVIEWQRES